MTTHRHDDLATPADDDTLRDGDVLPPPPPGDAVLTSDVEQRIRDDERARMSDELNALTERDVTHDDLADRESVARQRELAARDEVDEHRMHEAVRGDYVEEEVVRERTFSVGQALTLLVGAALTVLGIIALVATGVDTPLDQPVEEVIGFDHTPLLGIGELAAGVLLLLAALRPGGRFLAAVVGAALVVVGVMIVAEMDWTVDELGAEQSYGWIPIVAGALAMLGALMTPRRHQVVTEAHIVDRHDDARI